MKKLLSLMHRAPKRTSALFAMIAVALIAPLALNAWGPKRTEFSVKSPAPYVVFNSIVDNPDYRDEFNFVRIKDAANTQPGGWSDELNVQQGKEYLVQMYVHNNAAANLNLVAENVKAKFNVPATTGKSVQIDGFLSASNIGADTKGNKGAYGEVWDQAIFKSDKNFNIAYVAGSAIYHNNKTGIAGVKLSDSLVTNTGVPLGYELPLDGKMPGCFKYSGYVTFKVKAQVQETLNFDVEKTVRVSDAADKTFKENVNVKPGDKVDYQIHFKNTGESVLNKVVIRDMLPEGITYVPGTTYLHNVNGTRQVTDGITGNGLEIGNYGKGGGAYLKFTAQVAANNKLPKCGKNILKNVARATTEGYQKDDDATVTVDKNCPPEPKYTCDSLTVKKLDRTKFEFNTAYTVKDATFKSVEYVVRNANGTEVYRGTNNTFSTETAGKYSVQSYVTVTVNGSDKTVTSESCKKEFEVVKPKVPGVDIDKKVDGVEHKVVGVNQEFVYQLTVTNTGDVDLEKVLVTDNAPEHVQFIRADKGEIKDNKWSLTIPELKVGQSVNIAITAKVTKEVSGTIKNTACVDAPQVPGTPDDCDDATVEVKIKVCELKSKTIIVIKKNDFDKSKHSTDLNDCTEMKVCDLTSKKIVTIKKGDFDNKKYSTNLDDCAETPVTPPELPTTGIGDSLSALLGLGSLVASVSYYIASRRSLGL